MRDLLFRMSRTDFHGPIENKAKKQRNIYNCLCNIMHQWAAEIHILFGRSHMTTQTTF